MTALYFVRNGRTEEGTGFEANPSLDEIGCQQAESVAKQLGFLKRMPVYVSPQNRALETAKPLARSWGATVQVDEDVSLMPLPPQSPECDRKAWLMRFMKGSWADAPAVQTAWRENCLKRLRAMPGDAVIFSHFIVINMVVGAAIGDDRVVVFQPDNGSITIVENDGGKLSLVERGREAATWLL